MVLLLDDVFVLFADFQENKKFDPFCSKKTV